MASLEEELGQTASLELTDFLLLPITGFLLLALTDFLLLALTLYRRVSKNGKRQENTITENTGRATKPGQRLVH